MPVLQVAHLDLVFPGGAALRTGSSPRLLQGRNRRGRNFSIALLPLMRRLAHQAFQISAGVTAFNVAGLRSFPSVAAASDHYNDHPSHDLDVSRRRTVDRFALDEFWRNRLETELGSNLRDTRLRRVHLLDLSGLLPVK